MKLEFYKYQGAGNDFVMIDNRKQNVNLTKEQIAFLCNRHFGIGADGLILLENDLEFDFSMIYYNSDGSESTMCGNGGRCIVRFSNDLGLIKNKTKFNAIDGVHQAFLKNGLIELGMSDVTEINQTNRSLFLDTGSPHHVEFHNDIDDLDVYSLGKKIRNEVYGKEGSNVNFVEVISSNELKIRTYERGVENETLACGTGVTAAAIAAHKSGKINQSEIKVKAKGGDLMVRFLEENNHYKNIFLIGEAKQVFNGSIEV